MNNSQHKNYGSDNNGSYYNQFQYQNNNKEQKLLVDQNYAVGIFMMVFSTL
jgi:hypothetical protein